MSTYGELRIIPGFPPYAGPSIFTITYGETHILGVVGNTINFFNDTVRDIEEQLFVLLAERLEQLFCLLDHFIHKFLGNLGVHFYLYIFLVYFRKGGYILFERRDQLFLPLLLKSEACCKTMAPEILKQI